MNPCANCGKTWDVPCDARCPSPRFASEFDRLEWLAKALLAAQEREREEAVSEDRLLVAYTARLRAQCAYIEATSPDAALALVARLRAAEALLNQVMPRCQRFVPMGAPLRGMDQCGEIAVAVDDGNHDVCINHRPATDLTDEAIDDLYPHVPLLRAWTAAGGQS